MRSEVVEEGVEDYWSAGVTFTSPRSAGYTRTDIWWARRSGDSSNGER